MSIEQKLAELSQAKNKVKGYYQVKATGKFKAIIMHKKKHYDLGDYETEKEARNAYLEAKRLITGVTTDSEGSTLEGC